MNVRFSSFIKTIFAAALVVGLFAASSASAAVYFPIPVPEVTVTGGSTYTVTTGTQTVVTGGGQQTQTMNTMPVTYPTTVINVYSTAATTTIHSATSTVVIISGPASSTPVMTVATTTASSAPAEIITTNYTFTKNLSLGSRGKEVTELQKMLINLNFKITYPQTGDMAVASGVFDVQTRNALIAFQKHYGIMPAAGFFGPITRALVNGWAK